MGWRDQTEDQVFSINSGGRVDEGMGAGGGDVAGTVR